MKLDKEIFKVFKPPKKRYYLGKIIHGSPYFQPRNFLSTIISFRKLILRTEEESKEYSEKYPYLKYSEESKFSNLPLVRRNKEWIKKIFGTYWFIQVGFPIFVRRYDLGWKDKFESPRFEFLPSFQIYFFNWQFCIHWSAPDNNDGLYYEMILWWKYYSDKDIKKAEETWGWINTETNKSTWNKDYLL